LETRIAIGEALRCLLPQRGIDPARLATLRVCDEAAAELAAMPAPHPAAAPRRAFASRRERGEGSLRRRAPSPPRRGEGWGEGPATELNPQLEALVQRYRDDPAIDFSQASLADALAWYIAQSEAGVSHFAADLLQKQRQDDPKAVTG
jgi:hypothetical protein